MNHYKEKREERQLRLRLRGLEAFLSLEENYTKQKLFLIHCVPNWVHPKMKLTTTSRNKG